MKKNKTKNRSPDPLSPSPNSVKGKGNGNDNFKKQKRDTSPSFFGVSRKLESEAMTIGSPERSFKQNDPIDLVPYNVQSEVTVDTEPSMELEPNMSNREKFINSQLSNRYSRFNTAPFSVLVESVSTDNDAYSNIGNLHPMKIGKMLNGKFKSITSIKRRGKGCININFSSYVEANKFTDSKNLFHQNCKIYIPNFKIYRTGVIRDVEKSLSNEEIIQGISWPDSEVKISNLERLKFKDKNGLLQNSSSIKMVFESNLIPEYLYIWNVRCRVFPFINKVRKCINCCRWGHSVTFCRSNKSCDKCGENHDSVDCDNPLLKCINCGEDHSSFDPSCTVFQKYKLINSVMAYANCPQFIARRIIKSRNIVDNSQVHKLLKSSAYIGWNNNIEDRGTLSSDIITSGYKNQKHMPSANLFSSRKTNTIDSSSVGTIDHVGRSEQNTKVNKPMIHRSFQKLGNIYSQAHSQSQSQSLSNSSLYSPQEFHSPLSEKNIAEKNNDIVIDFIEHRLQEILKVDNNILNTKDCTTIIREIIGMLKSN